MSCQPKLLLVSNSNIHERVDFNELSTKIVVS